MWTVTDPYKIQAVVRIWDLKRRVTIEMLCPMHVGALAFSPNGRQLLAIGHGIASWDIERGNNTLAAGEHVAPVRRISRIFKVGFDGRTLHFGKLLENDLWKPNLLGWDTALPGGPVVFAIEPNLLHLGSTTFFLRRGNNISEYDVDGTREIGRFTTESSGIASDIALAKSRTTAATLYLPSIRDTNGRVRLRRIPEGSSICDLPGQYLSAGLFLHKTDQLVTVRGADGQSIIERWSDQCKFLSEFSVAGQINAIAVSEDDSTFYLGNEEGGVLALTQDGVLLRKYPVARSPIEYMALGAGRLVAVDKSNIVHLLSLE